MKKKKNENEILNFNDFIKLKRKKNCTEIENNPSYLSSFIEIYSIVWQVLNV